jgi:hypothetical protein
LFVTEPGHDAQSEDWRQYESLLPPAFDLWDSPDVQTFLEHDGSEVTVSRSMADVIKTLGVPRFDFKPVGQDID